MCNCRHWIEQHGDDGGPCTGLDSYGIPCECPSYQEMDDGDEEDGE